MAAYAAIVAAFVLGLYLHLRGARWWVALGFACLVVPAFVLVVALFELPGWEWWEVALIFGTLYGAAAACAGVALAHIIRRRRGSA